MASVRLRADQIQRLRESGSAAHIIRYAVRRWKRGDFTIGEKPKRKKGGEVLAVFPLWKKPDGVEDWQLRAILDQHWKIPDEAFLKELDRDIARLDKEIAEMMRCLPPFVIESDMEL